ncbi:hypothetical protein, partial [Mesorhizobium sp. M7A.F.Ca.ET.027.03.2.1]|uniref:hypothetical protein n=1 Tax=Mesorhizobium sp. M7A.F.Ca.ET.027.03.2.1 TaxID=2496656 RepID=UPI001AECB8CB
LIRIETADKSRGSAGFAGAGWAALVGEFTSGITAAAETEAVMNMRLLRPLEILASDMAGSGLAGSQAAQTTRGGQSSLLTSL